MGPAQTNDFVKVPSIQHPVDQPGGKAVAAPDAVDDPKLTRRTDGPLAIAPGYGAPLMAVLTQAAVGSMTSRGDAWHPSAGLNWSSHPEKGVRFLGDRNLPPPTSVCGKVRDRHEKEEGGVVDRFRLKTTENGGNDKDHE